MTEPREKAFKPRAHILTLLGEELIKNPVMAIYELIKNSYDADAKKVSVDFINIANEEEATIVLEDDGIGMTEEIIKNVWLEPGTDFRKPRKDNKKTIKRSFIYKRAPMGEKGVGRFAVHRLSNIIHLKTRPLIIEYNEEKKEIISSELADYEIELKIDWSKFTQSKYLSEIKVTWKKNENINDFHFKSSEGTYIKLAQLKEPWTRGMARQLKRNILSMTSPHNDPDKFNISLNFHNNWIEDIPDLNTILEKAPYQFKATIDEEYNILYDYIFELHNDDKIGKRASTGQTENIKTKIESFIKTQMESEDISEEIIDKKINTFANKPSSIGKFEFKIYSYDLDPKSLRDTYEKYTLIKSILKPNSGIRIYKDDLRVYDYGEPGNDWLGLDLKRVNNKESISNNQNIGFIILNSEQSTTLVEKTNREGFIENEHFTLFKIVVKELIAIFEAERSKDRNKWRKHHLKLKEDRFSTGWTKLKQTIERASFINPKDKDAIIEDIENVKKEHDAQTDILLLSAGLGLTVSAAFHEIEKLIPLFEKHLKQNPLNRDLLTQNIKDLKGFVKGITGLVKTGSVEVDIKDAIARSIAHYKLKFRRRKVTPIVSINDNIKTIFCDKRYLIQSLMNIIDNSIYWLDTIHKEKKEIYIKAYEDTQNNKHIIIADNGPGYQDDIVEIVRPFFTRKQEGTGLGMYIVDTIMMNYGKLEIISDKTEIKDLELPDQFTGAITHLIFSKNQHGGK